jgi:hypothetical protein
MILSIRCVFDLENAGLKIEAQFDSATSALSGVTWN